MDLDEARAYVRQNSHAVLSTVRKDGTPQMSPVAVAVDPLVEYYRAVAGEHEDWDEYRRAMVAEQRCLLRVTLVRAGPHRAG